MTRTVTLLILNVAFWLVVGLVVVRTNALTPGDVRFRWSELHRPNAIFRWNSAPIAGPILASAGASRSFKVTIPRSFSSGELVIATFPGAGVLTAGIEGSNGQPNTTQSRPGGGVIVLPLSWGSIALQNRSFNVDLAAMDQPVRIDAIHLILRRR